MSTLILLSESLSHFLFTPPSLPLPNRSGRCCRCHSTPSEWRSRIMDLMLPIVLFLFLMVWYFVSHSERGRCPRCQSEQTKYSPWGCGSFRQILEGFNICRECGAEFFQNGKLRVPSASVATITRRWLPVIMVQIVSATLLILLFVYFRPSRDVLPPTPAPRNQPELPAVASHRRPLGPVTFDPITGRAIAPVPSGMTREEFDRLATPELP